MPPAQALLVELLLVELTIFARLHPADPAVTVNVQDLIQSLQIQDNTAARCPCTAADTTTRPKGCNRHRMAHRELMHLRDLLGRGRPHDQVGQVLDPSAGGADLEERPAVTGIGHPINRALRVPDGRALETELVGEAG